MNKQEFLGDLKAKLISLPQGDVEERLSFYSEMIDDRVEEGLTEEQAICELGTIESIAAQIMSEIPLTKLVKEKVKPNRKLSVWEIVLLVLGSPIWLSLLTALFAIVVSIYAVVWSVIISLWAVEFSLAACSVSSAFFAIVFIAEGNMIPGVAMLGAGILCAGFAIFGFYVCKYTTSAILKSSKKILIWIKSCFMRKEAIEE